MGHASGAYRSSEPTISTSLSIPHGIMIPNAMASRDDASHSVGGNDPDEDIQENQESSPQPTKEADDVEEQVGYLGPSSPR